MTFYLSLFEFLLLSKVIFRINLLHKTYFEMVYNYFFRLNTKKTRITISISSEYFVGISKEKTKIINHATFQHIIFLYIYIFCILNDRTTDEIFVGKMFINQRNFIEKIRIYISEKAAHKFIFKYVYLYVFCGLTDDYSTDTMIIV